MLKKDDDMRSGVGAVPGEGRARSEGEAVLSFKICIIQKLFINGSPAVDAADKC